MHGASVDRILVSWLRNMVTLFHLFVAVMGTGFVSIIVLMLVLFLPHKFHPFK
ncbi:hypothetical protein NSMM_310036 [Nitrosomonas mobilis]|uniref:Uncharacterized protein n=1 Tax=Nitrosomonas mobilis TaxID=51642 RepID=A0A1G5SCM8_9PROT|nr:hypothetical protein NSMM_310036 [Nitrosomonas mobilis]